MPIGEPIASTIRSTPCFSYHARATVDATSGLFWWSAETISLFLPPTVPPKPCPAIRAASTDPAPVLSENTPSISVSTPMRTTSPETWADAPAEASAHARATAEALATILLIEVQARLGVTELALQVS